MSLRIADGGALGFDRRVGAVRPVAPEAADAPVAEIREPAQTRAQGRHDPVPAAFASAAMAALIQAQEGVSERHQGHDQDERGDDEGRWPRPVPPPVTPPAMVVTPEMRATPPILEVVRAQLRDRHVAPPLPPFSRRNPSPAQADRLNALKLASLKTVWQAQAALPLLQQAQMSLSPFQTVSAPYGPFAYAPGFGRGRLV